MTNTNRIANRLARILGFDQVAVTATAFETETESYVITSGTGEGGDFAYLASDVERFCEGRERAHYSEDFCASVSPVEDVEVAWAALADGAVLCRAGDCRAILQGARCEAGDTAEDYDCGEIVRIVRSGAEVKWDSNQTTTQALSALRPSGERPVRDYEFALDVNDPLAGLVNEHEMDDTADDVRTRGAEAVAHELIQNAASAGAGPTGMEMLRATIAALKALAPIDTSSLMSLSDDEVQSYR